MPLIARTGLLVLAVATFLLNPAACAPGPEDDYQFGDAEMRAAIEGMWRVTIGQSTGAARTFTFRLAQAQGTPSASLPHRNGLIRPAMACGSRTLVRGAAACVNLTEMPLTGMIVEGDEAIRTLDVKGTMSVAGLSFTEANFTVMFGSRRLFGQLSKGGAVTSLGGDLLEGGTAAMVRVP
jgi:hypothetical protein